MPQKIKSNPLVTIIVPAYNEEKHIEECLVSIKNQTYPKIELVVIDDGSKDATAIIGKKYADVFMSREHQGPGVARNKAAKIAKGEILVFVDADMYLDKNYVKKIIKPILEGKALSTFTKEEYIANHENPWVKCYMFDNELKNKMKNKNSKFQVKYFRAISKEFFLNIGGYDTSMGYNDDSIKKKEIDSLKVSGAISFHYNPSTLRDIFVSSRWIGRSPIYRRTIRNLARYSFINSVRQSITKIKKGAPIRFLLYKITFDAGVSSGILIKNKKSNYAK